MGNITQQITEAEVALNHVQVENIVATQSAVSLYTRMLEDTAYRTAAPEDMMHDLVLVMEVRRHINQASTHISDAQAKLCELYAKIREREG